MRDIYQVVAPRAFVAGVEVDPITRRVVSTGELAEFAAGHSLEWLRNHCRENGWGLDRVL